MTSVEGVSSEQYGLASGLINTTQQIGGALGPAIVTAVASSRTSDLVESGSDEAVALTEGFQAALLLGAAFAALAIVLAVLLADGTPRRTPGGVDAADTEPATT